MSMPCGIMSCGRPTPDSYNGAVRGTLTSHEDTNKIRFYAAQISRHSIRAAARFCLKTCLVSRCLSWLKWLWFEQCTAVNFCYVAGLRNFCIALSRLRNGRWEFSHLLLWYCAVFCRCFAPRTFNAAPYEASLSVTISCVLPYFFISFLFNFNAVNLYLFFEAKASNTSPS